MMKMDRRRLLKGSLAAPVVLTVRPASATAITSATACLKRCEAKAHETRPPKMSPELHSDNWMRVELHLYKLAPSMKEKPYKGSFFLGHDKHTFWRLDERDPYVAPAEMTNHTKGSCHYEQTGKRMYAIAYVDEKGTIQGYAWENKWHASPATWSCYTSAVGMKHNV
jgi:hypothetical protein